MNFAEALAQSAETRRNAACPIAPDIQARMLLDSYAELTKTHQFTLGQLVQLKSATRGAFRYPAKGQPAIIVSIFDTLPAEFQSGHPLIGETVDVKIGIYDEVGDFMTAVMASRFLEPYDGKVDGA